MARVLLVIAAAACAFVAVIANTDWGWLGIDENYQTYRGFLAASAFWFALSFLPWSDWSARYSGRLR